MAADQNPSPVRHDPVDAFIHAMRIALDAGVLARAMLTKPRAAAGDRVRVSIRPVMLKGEAQLSFVHTHQTRDITKNTSVVDGLQQMRDLLETSFDRALLCTATEEVQLLISKRGKQTLLRGQASHVARPAAHDRDKHRYLTLDRPFLAELGVTDAQHKLIPAMARKWKQINAFVEVLDHALEAAGLKQGAGIEVLDFGSGKGYLTFAAHDHLRHTLGLAAQVTGVELRRDMVELCNGVAERIGAEGLRFDEGDVGTRPLQPTDVMVALHACDTATDYAIATGVSAGAKVIMCSPCCHKELRPQLLSPHPLRPILKHGVHLGQEAEMLTDGLRALLLDACGYDAQVFEFIALEHTHKNKMILAVRRPAASSEAAARRAAEIGEQIDAIKRFYGIREQCLERLLRDRLAA